MSGLIRDFYPSSFLCKKFSLNSKYFINAYKQKRRLNADMKMIDGRLYVRPPQSVIDKIENGSCVARQLDPCEDKNYDFIYELSSNTKIGFWE